MVVHRDQKSWSDGDIKVAVSMWMEGCSARQITKVLVGRTRNSIIGKIHRLGMTGKDKQQSTFTHGVNPRNVMSKRDGAIAMVVSPTKTKRGPTPPRVVKGSELDNARPWETRVFGECAYPVIINGETYSCCTKTFTNYCQYHRKIMFIPRKPR